MAIAAVQDALDGIQQSLPRAITIDELTAFSDYTLALATRQMQEYMQMPEPTLEECGNDKELHLKKQQRVDHVRLKSADQAIALARFVEQRRVNEAIGTGISVHIGTGQQTGEIVGDED